MIKERGFGFKVVQTAAQLMIIQSVYYGLFFTFKIIIKIADLNFLRYSVYAVAIGFAFLVKSSLRIRSDLILTSPIWFIALKKAFSHVVFVAFCLFLLLVGSKNTGVSRFFLFTFFLVMGAALVLSEMYIPRVISGYLFNNHRLVRVVLVGRRLGDEKFKNWIKRQSLFGIQVVEKISISAITVGESVCSDSIDVDKIRKCLERVRAHQIIISDLFLSRDVIMEINNICDKNGVRIMFKFSADGVFGLLDSVSEDSGLIFAFPPGEPLENPFNRIIKRLVDIIIAIPVILFIIPLSSFIVWMLQKYDSPGPVLYRQRRCGINNILFEILKYRTMHTGVYDASRQARINDTRVSKYGKWLRKTSVDELPQFINVLKGEMSVVGPRPHMESHNLEWAELLNKYQKRSYVKPGITGLAQVRGLRGEARSADDILLRISSDIEYIESWSLWLDVKIIAKTITVVFFPPRTAV